MNDDFIQSGEPRRVVIVGLGGIGSWVLQALVPFLNFSLKKAWSLVLIDGDEYEEKNRTRQVFFEFGSKALVQASWVQRSFGSLQVDAIAQYLSADGAGDTFPVKEAINAGDVVFSCVDNHKTRKVLQDHCSRLKNSFLISGGNEFLDGNVQFFIRENGEDMTPRIDKYHPEIAHPGDKAPFELSCEEAAASSPQLIVTNMAAATLMLQVFYAFLEGGLDMGKPEVYFEVMKCAAMPRERKK